MKDRFNREVDYLRISVTDLCNLRCVYCMPLSGVAKKEHKQIISVERIKEVVLAASKLGITKVRLTGGEPLVRNGIIEICKEIKYSTYDGEILRTLQPDSGASRKMMPFKL